MPRSEPARPLAALTDAETDELRALAVRQRVLELGTYHGRATFALAAVAREVWTVDWHRGDDYMRSPDSLPVFASALARSPHRDRVVAVVGRFRQVLPLLGRRRFGLVFVDGSKDALELGFELSQAVRVLWRDGALAVHDYGRWDVTTVCGSLLGPPVRVVDSLAVWKAIGDRSDT